MKRILILVLLLVLGVFLVRVVRLRSVLSPGSNGEKEPETLGISEKGSPKTGMIKFGDQTFKYAYLRVEDPSQVDLINNFSAKQTAREVVDYRSCKFLVSASFYRDEQPIGLFVSDYETVSGFEKNNLLNGFLSINDFAIPRITTTIPRDRLKIAVQSGPVLVEDGVGKELDNINGNRARRLAAVVDGDNRLYFVTVYSPTQLFDGPKLADLSSTVVKIFESAGIVVADAINLDGGGASAFLIGSLELTELKPVGSFFCGVAGN